MKYFSQNIFTFLPPIGALLVLLGLIALLVFIADLNTGRDQRTQGNIAFTNGNFLTVHDQPLGKFVTVAEVSMPYSGFLLLQKMNGSSQPSVALAAPVYLEAGSHNNVPLVLDEKQGHNPKSGEALFVSIIWDVDDNHVYDISDFDASPRDNSGWPFRAAFSIK